MKEIESYTCVRFVPHTTQVDFIEIQDGDGCSSFVGRNGLGSQRLRLQKFGCTRHGTVVHELIHALGFYHTQSSFDRNNFVKVNYENVISGREHNFKIIPTTHGSYFGTSYDYDSIMHYSRRAFSKNGLDTIETINPSDIKRIGQTIKMSSGDIARINNMYSC